MTDAQRRGIEWRAAVLRQLDAELTAKSYHGTVLITLAVRGGAIIDIEKTYSEKAMRPDPAGMKAN